ncbi:MAG: TonB-dependent receptor [Spirochaetes bacterium]|nr:TonB-dependent receptor [Spirochaetota bacterium]
MKLAIPHPAPLSTILGAIFFLSGLASPWAEARDTATNGEGTRRFRLQLTGQKDFSGTTVLIDGIDVVLVARRDGVLQLPMEDNGETLPLAPGRYRAQAHLKTRSQGIDFSVDEAAPDTIVLPVAERRSEEIRTKKLDSVQVTSDHRQESVSRNAILASEARLMPGTGGDPVKAIMNFPGVVPQNFGSQQLIVRGGDNADNVFLLDGIRIGSAFHDIGFYSVFHPASLESVDFYPGAFPTRYGNAIGGIIDLKGRAGGESRKVDMEIDANLASAALFLSVPLGPRVRLSLGGRRTYYEFYLGLIRGIQIPELATIKEALTAFDAVPFFYDYGIRLEWNPNPRHRLLLLASGAQDKMTVQSDRFPDISSNGNSNFNLSWETEKTWNAQGLMWEYRGGKFESRATVWHYDYTNNNNFMTVPLNTSKPDLWGASLLQSLRVARSFRLEYGADLLYESFPFSISEMSNGGRAGFNFSLIVSGRGPDIQADKYISRNFTNLRRSLTPFFEGEVALGKFTLNLGLRALWNLSTAAVDLDPRVLLRFAPHRDWEAWARWGLYSQLPDPMQATDLYGDALLPARRSQQAVLGGKWSPRWFELKTELYWKDLQRLSTGNPTWDGFFATGADNPRFIPEGQGRSYGLEVLLRQKPGTRLSGWVAYTLSRSERTRFTNVLNVMTSSNLFINDGLVSTNWSQDWAAYAQDVTHTLTLAANYDLVPKRFRIGSRLVFSTGKPYTARIVTNAGATLYLVDGPWLAERYPFRFTLDLRLEVFFKLFGGEGSVYLDCWNVQFPFRENVQSYVFTPTGLTPDMIGKPAEKKSIGDLPILPLLGVMWKY